jgi:glycosyltransferase involved in cell wall biosynthesis
LQLLHGKAKFYALCVNPGLAERMRQLDVHVFSFVPTVKWGKYVHTLIGMAGILFMRIRFRVDTVWVQGVPEVAFLPFARMLGCTSIATRHCTFEPSISRTLYPFFAACANKIICVSKVVADDLADIVSSTRLVVISNWIPLLPDPLEIQEAEGRPIRLLFVGRLERYKGLYLILDAMRRFKLNGSNRAVSLTVVGEGEYRKELERQAGGLDVRFAGFQKDASEFYRIADVFINPSLGPEGLPLVSLEAMSYGLPCIFSDLPVHKEITDDGRCALLFRSGDALDLSLNIQMFLSSEETRKQYKNASRDVIVNRYSAEVAYGNYVRELRL